MLAGGTVGAGRGAVGQRHPRGADRGGEAVDAGADTPRRHGGLAADRLLGTGLRWLGDRRCGLDRRAETAGGRPRAAGRGGGLDPVGSHVDPPRRAGDDAALGQDAEPQARRPGRPRAGAGLGGRLRRGPRPVHPEGGGLVAARPFETRCVPGARLSRRPWCGDETLCPERRRAAVALGVSRTTASAPRPSCGSPGPGKRGRAPAKAPRAARRSARPRSPGRT
ncbi:hypothetical protein EV662_102206 [Rhodovulum marinum]|uniref:Uncharacterized protein n=1 Tax=Rhodovulum marinum TaxID=320662 RepID=A0A4R2Q525_9RHOB|nr:hypothetical protein EV662_102206 [Rhodovulum marinum]